MNVKKYSLCLFLLFGVLFISGCAKTNVHLDENLIYLCSYNYDTGISVLDANGTSILKLSDADIFLCTAPDGTILSDVGQIPANSILFIQFYNNNQMRSGVWNAGKKDWEIEPVNGSFASYTSIYDGKLTYFYIGEDGYGLDFKPYSEQQQTYQVGDGIIL